MATAIFTGSASPGAAATGQSCQGHLQYAVNQGAWWSFFLTGTDQLAATYSTDGTTWNTPAGSPYRLTAAHGSEGRNFGFAYANISSLDILHMASAYAGSSFYHSRFTLGTTWNNTHAEVASWTTSSWSGGNGNTTGMDSAGYLADTGSNTGPIDSMMYTTAADAGSSWTNSLTSATTDYPSINGVRVSAVIPMGTHLLILYNSDSATFVNLRSVYGNHTSWGGATTVLGTPVTGTSFSACGACGRTSTDAHVVILANNSNTYTHVRHNGSSWSAGDSVPTLTLGTNSGIALASDGTYVWAFAADTSKNIQYSKWTSGSGWGAWTVLEATRTNAPAHLIACINSGGTAIQVAWTELNGSNYEGWTSQLSLVTGPTTATLSGPTSGTVGIPSSNFTITLDQPAGVGGVSCPVSSSVGGDTVTTSPVVISVGNTTGTFTVTPSSAGSRNVILGATTPSLTLAGTPIAYMASVVGTGAATLAALAGAGTGIFTVPGSGAVTLVALTGAGSGVMTSQGGGAVTLAALTGIGTGGFTVPGEGTATLAALIGAGIGTAAEAGASAGTGAATLDALVAAGTGIFTTAGIGAASLSALIAAGTGSFTVIGTGAASLASLVGAGLGSIGPVWATSSLTLTGQRYLTTTPNGLMDNQSQVSLSFFWKYTGDPTQAAGVRILSRAYQGTFTCYTSANDANSVKLKFIIANASSQAEIEHVYPVNTVFHFALTYDGVAAQQILYENGESTIFGTLAGNTRASGDIYFAVGTPSTPGAAAQFEIQDVAIWHWYVLTGTDVANLRDGIQIPLDIGLSATHRTRWLLSGTIGNAPQVGDIGLANNFGDATHALTAIAGTGSAAYSELLTFIPAAGISRAYVQSSGQTVAVFFESLVTRQEVLASSLPVAPTIYKNGSSLGQLINPSFIGQFHGINYLFPVGTSCAPGDVMTLSAPLGWAITSAGITNALSALPIANYSGRSILGSDASGQRTMPVGLNISNPSNQDYSLYCAPRNMRYRGVRFGNGATYSTDGKILTMTADTAEMKLETSGSIANGIDATTYPGVTGLYAVGWDGNTSATFAISVKDTTNATATERMDLRNNGDVNGIGKVRVFDVQYVGSPANLNLQLWLILTDTSRTPVFDNLVVYGPSDFTATAPVVLDKSDPLALGAVFLDRVKNGVAALRYMDSTIGGEGGCTGMSEPEHYNLGTDWTWQHYQTRRVGYIQARKCDPAVSQYIYSSILGEPYSAILAADIDSSQTTIVISDAATAPVLAGETLKIGNEILRVFAVSGTSVTVERGSEGTMAVSHVASQVNPISVNGRFAFTGIAMFGQDLGRWFELVSSAPHGLKTGDRILHGTFPTLTMSDGTVATLTGYVCAGWVTSATSVMACISGIGTVSGVNVTMPDTPVTLDPDVNYDDFTFPDYTMFPYDLTAHWSGLIPGADHWVNVGHLASNSLVDWIARKIKDNFPAGRRVWVEYVNEPWNVGFGQHQFLAYANAVKFPGGNWLAAYAWRACQIGQRFRNVFGSRAGEIRLLLNMQPGTTDVTPILNLAHTNGWQVDAIANAPYVGPNISAASRLAWQQASNEQAIDLYIHDMLYGSYTDSIATALTYEAGAIAACNAANGTHVVFIGYEGGAAYAIPPSASTLNGAIDDTVTTINVASGAQFVAGQHALIESEWVLIDSIATNALTVTRAQLGSSAAAHADTTAMRSDYIERNRDIAYNPQFAIAEWDLYKLCQETMEFICIYNYSAGYYRDLYLWGMWHGDGQLSGSGDGLDEKHDNRLTLAQLGLANSKIATINQDQVNVSVRGFAFESWMASVEAAPSAPIGAASSDDSGNRLGGMVSATTFVMIGMEIY